MYPNDELKYVSPSVLMSSSSSSSSRVLSSGAEVPLRLEYETEQYYNQDTENVWVLFFKHFIIFCLLWMTNLQMDTEIQLGP